MKNRRINPNSIKTRDLLTVKLINGATKANIQNDRKKEADRRACRNWKREEY